MKVIVCQKYGPPEVLELKEVVKPAPKDNEVLIRVYATTVAAADSTVRGLKVPIALKLPLRIYAAFIRPKPIILGQELAGDIEAVGNAVTRFRLGDQVVGWTGFRLGANAEYICLPEKGVLTIKLSNTMSR